MQVALTGEGVVRDHSQSGLKGAETTAAAAAAAVAAVRRVVRRYP